MYLKNGENMFEECSGEKNGWKSGEKNGLKSGENICLTSGEHLFEEW